MRGHRRVRSRKKSDRSRPISRAMARLPLRWRSMSAPERSGSHAYQAWIAWPGCSSEPDKSMRRPSAIASTSHRRVIRRRPITRTKVTRSPRLPTSMSPSVVCRSQNDASGCFRARERLARLFAIRPNMRMAPATRNDRRQDAPRPRAAADRCRARTDGNGHGAAGASPQESSRGRYNWRRAARAVRRRDRGGNAYR